MNRLLPSALTVLVLMVATVTSAAPFTALKDGERFRFQISWGIFSNAGEIILQANRETNAGVDYMKVRTKIASRGFIRGVYKFDNDAEPLIDMATGRLLSASEEGKGGSRGTRTQTTFDYTTRKGTHTDALHPDRSREFSLGSADPTDLITALIQTRDWNSKVGDHRAVSVYFGRDLYPVVIRAESRETVKTPKGTFTATQLVPRMESETPRGVFQQGGEIKVWVSEGTDPQPVQMQLKLNFGTARLTLVEHTLASQPVP